MMFSQGTLTLMCGSNLELENQCSTFIWNQLLTKLVWEYPGVCPFSMHWLDVTPHHLSKAKLRRVHGKHGNPSKQLLLFLRNYLKTHSTSLGKIIHLFKFWKSSLCECIQKMLILPQWMKPGNWFLLTTKIWKRSHLLGMHCSNISEEPSIKLVISTF